MCYTLQYNFLSCRNDDEQYEITDLFHVFTKLRKAYTYKPNKKGMAESNPMCTQKRFFVDQKYADFLKVIRHSLIGKKVAKKVVSFERERARPVSLFIY